MDNGIMTRSYGGRINSNVPPLNLGSGGEDNNCYTGMFGLLVRRYFKLMISAEILSKNSVF